MNTENHGHFNPDPMSFSRRRFIGGMAATAAAIPFTGVFASALTDVPETSFRIAFFTKPLDSYELPFMAETLVQATVDGLDLSVRPKGKVEPEQVRDELPGVIEIIRKYGLDTEMMVTSITSPEDPFAKQVLETAARMGIKHYRLGYYDYDFNKGMTASLGMIREKIEQLSQFNKQTGIQGGYQNHTGTRFGAPVWDIWTLIKDLPASAISCQFDVRHAVTEGSSSWILALHLMRYHIGSIAVKDFTWKVEGGKARIVNVPLGEGIVNFDLFFKSLKDLNIHAPISLHVEYPLLSAEEENRSLLQKQKVIAARIKKDVDFVRMYLLKYQLI